MDDGEDQDHADRSHISVSSDEPDPAPVKHKTAVVRGVRDLAPLPRNARGGNGIDLVEKMAKVFDPAAQELREQQRANRSLQSAQFMASAQQSRDTLAVIESLRLQITTLQARVYDADRARDLSQLKLEMMQASSFATPKPTMRVPPKYMAPKLRRKTRNEVRYVDGGGSVTWVTDNEATDDEGEDVIGPALNPRRLKRTYAFRESPSPPSHTSSMHPCNLTTQPLSPFRHESPSRSAMRGLDPIPNALQTNTSIPFDSVALAPGFPSHPFTSRTNVTNSHTTAMNSPRKACRIKVEAADAIPAVQFSLGNHNIKLENTTVDLKASPGRDGAIKLEGENIPPASY